MAKRGNSFDVLQDKAKMKRQLSHERRAEEKKRRKVVEPGEVLRRAEERCKTLPVTVIQEDPIFDYYLVIDFEATCEANDNNWKHEIIEFPIVVICGRTGNIHSQFHRYVRPTLNPILTPFCFRLTGIKQRWVDESPLLDAVLQEVHEWLYDLGMFEDKVSFITVTDGPWDFRKFYWEHSVLEQQKISLNYPYYRQWVDMRVFFKSVFGFSGNIRVMLRNVGLEFVGNAHSGIDDSTNIARILVSLLTRKHQPSSISEIDITEWDRAWKRIAEPPQRKRELSRERQFQKLAPDGPPPPTYSSAEKKRRSRQTPTPPLPAVEEEEGPIGAVPVEEPDHRVLEEEEAVPPYVILEEEPGGGSVVLEEDHDKVVYVDVEGEGEGGGGGGGAAEAGAIEGGAIPGRVACVAEGEGSAIPRVPVVEGKIDTEGVVQGAIPVARPVPKARPVTQPKPKQKGGTGRGTRKR